MFGRMCRAQLGSVRTTGPTTVMRLTADLGTDLGTDLGEADYQIPGLIAAN
jgi:hypothetical protein